MKSNLIPYSFPFQKIFNFLETDVDKKLEDFYNSFKNEYHGHRIKNIDTDKIEIQFYKDCYNSGEIEYETYTFENEIKFYCLNLIYKSFDVISEGIDICFISKQSDYNYLDKLERQYNGLLSHPRNKQFPFLLNHLNLIGLELNRYKTLDNIEENNKMFKNSPFKPSDSLKRSFFYNLYDICILHNILKDDFPREDFIDVFRGPSTMKFIVFNCENDLMITFFEGIKPVFANIKASSIEKSKRFFTKRKKLLTTAIYDSSKNRIKLKLEITELNEDLEELISEFK